MMDLQEYIKDSLGKFDLAVKSFPPKQQADLNRFIQNIGSVMSDQNKTGEQKTAEVLLMQKKMQEQNADNNNK